MNQLSVFGRMSYGAHFMFYPLTAAFIMGVAMPWYNNKCEKDDQKAWDAMPAARTVDPDLFNPFTPIPYHNNEQLKYGFAHIHMHNYLNKNHMNVGDYPFKNYHNSFDQNSENEYLYNWVSVHAAQGH